MHLCKCHFYGEVKARQPMTQYLSENIQRKFENSLKEVTGSEKWRPNLKRTKMNQCCINPNMKRVKIGNHGTYYLRHNIIIDNCECMACTAFAVEEIVSYVPYNIIFSLSRSNLQREANPLICIYIYAYSAQYKKKVCICGIAALTSTKLPLCTNQGINRIFIQCKTSSMYSSIIFPLICTIIVLS